MKTNNQFGPRIDRQRAKMGRRLQGNFITCTHNKTGSEYN